MASKVDIVNLALTLLGATRINSLTDNSESARKMNESYDLIRRELLRSHPWNFAIKRQQLSILAETPLFEYTYKFQLPSDCLRMIKLTTGEVTVRDYYIENRQVCCDEGTLYIRYIADITDTELFDAAFVTCFAARLASELAHAFANDKNLMQLMYELYEKKLRLAKAMDAQESADSKLNNQDYFTGTGRT